MIRARRSLSARPSLLVSVARSRPDDEVPPGLRVVNQEVQVLVGRGVKRGGDQHGIARGRLRGIALAAARPQQVLRPDDPLLPRGIEDAAAEGREDVPVGVGVEVGATSQRSLRRQGEFAAGEQPRAHPLFQDQPVAQVHAFDHEVLPSRTDGPLLGINR